MQRSNRHDQSFRYLPSSRHAGALPPVSTPPGPSADDESDDIDDLLNEAGAIVHRSTGEAGTKTEAQPDPKSIEASANGANTV
ncbi:hypothetical protein [Caballeronia cordobensis]|uniref:hypothetical protein n=1 Tax=Caballeronia cordobensis TaxID=1353886 RepID=UPI0007C7488F|nr:hypothetical protein [Caballeronia cordobensis]